MIKCDLFGTPLPIPTCIRDFRTTSYCNEKVLDENDYQIADTILSFETPKCLPGTNDLHVIIYDKKTTDHINVTKAYHPHGILFFFSI